MPRLSFHAPPALNNKLRALAGDENLSDVIRGLLETALGEPEAKIVYTQAMSAGRVLNKRLLGRLGKVMSEALDKALDEEFPDGIPDDTDADDEVSP